MPRHKRNVIKYGSQINMLSTAFLAEKCPAVTEDTLRFPRTNDFFGKWLINCGLSVYDKTSRDYLFRCYHQNIKSLRKIIDVRQSG